MPTVLRKDGFNFMIYTDDHEPMHTHVKKAGKEVVINLGGEGVAPSLRKNKDMGKKNIRKAIKIVFGHQEYLIEKWKELHGDN